MKGKVDSFNSLNSLCIVHITSSLICLSISLFFHSFIHSFLSVFLYWFIYLWYHAIVISLLKRAIKEEWNKFWFYMKQLKEDLIDLIHQLFALLKDRCMEGRICRHDKFKVMYFFYIFVSISGMDKPVGIEKKIAHYLLDKKAVIETLEVLVCQKPSNQRFDCFIFKIRWHCLKCFEEEESFFF